MIKGAYISENGEHRYALWRIWDKSAPCAMFIGLNPSTADAKNDDPTLKRCMGYANAWGYGGVYLGNLFAYRSTDPEKLYTVSDPIGPENDLQLCKMARKAAIVIAAWGNGGIYKNRACQIINMFSGLHCLGQTKKEKPKHPLYLPSDLEPIPFVPTD